MLDRLRRPAFRFAILSNGTPDMLAAAVRSAGLGGAFDALLSVESTGIFKPARAVYDLVVRGSAQRRRRCSSCRRTAGTPPERPAMVSAPSGSTATACRWTVCLAPERVLNDLDGIPDLLEAR